MLAQNQAVAGKWALYETEEGGEPVGEITLNDKMEIVFLDWGEIYIYDTVWPQEELAKNEGLFTYSTVVHVPHQAPIRRGPPGVRLASKKFEGLLCLVGWFRHCCRESGWRWRAPSFYLFVFVATLVADICCSSWPTRNPIYAIFINYSMCFLSLPKIMMWRSKSGLKGRTCFLSASMH